ncbi:related to O-methyltransferase [Rhynchosporium agropyri]|uniref:Related to O-methyltransferase n=1 Tax=Rhynchosporium agropyri TaxID=914238 RepID=A0A1E1LIH9_9HELO|nr:related to O-methyltransferase [Rhynchosporium agropyri]
MRSLLELVQQVQVAAENVAAGKGGPENMELMRTIRNLTRVAEPPAEKLLRLYYQPAQNAMLRLAVELGLPHALVEAKTMNAEELAVKSGADKLFIVRIMRLLIAIDIVDETGEEQYSATPITEALASETWTSAARFTNDTLVPTYAKILEYYRDTGFRSSEKTAIEYAVGADFWTWVKGHPSLHKDFHLYMRGRKDGSRRWLDYFPVATQVGDLSTAKDSVTLVDVGGNFGHDLKLFRESFPNLPGRLVLMDLPEVLQANPDPLEGIEKVDYDFFTQQPIIGAKFYIFRSICHDWPDKDCVKFLTNTIRAMKPGYSRLLINERVLPNVGAELQSTVMDIAMMTYYHAMERSERQWRTLLASVGLEIVKIWSLESGDCEAVIEAVLKE